MIILKHLETCQSGFFQGHGDITFAIPVSALTTKQELRDDLISEINAREDMADLLPSDSDVEQAVDDILADTSEHPFLHVDQGLEMPEGFYADEKQDGTWRLMEGDVDSDDQSDDEVIEDNLKSFAACVTQAHMENDTLDSELYCYFGIVRADPSDL